MPIERTRTRSVVKREKMKADALWAAAVSSYLTEANAVAEVATALAKDLDLKLRNESSNELRALCAGPGCSNPPDTVQGDCYMRYCNIICGLKSFMELWRADDCARASAAATIAH